MNVMKTTTEDVSIFRFNGFLNYESIARVKSLFIKAAQNESKIVFNLDALNFVGSIGITDFVDVIILVSQKVPNGLALCGVSSEFQRVILSRTPTVSFYSSESQAIHSLRARGQVVFLESGDLMGGIHDELLPQSDAIKKL